MSGRRPYIKDFPYPVGNDPKTSWPSRNLTIHSFCFSFNSVTPAFLIANSIAPSIFRTESVSYEFYKHKYELIKMKPLFV